MAAIIILRGLDFTNCECKEHKLCRPPLLAQQPPVLRCSLTERHVVGVGSGVRKRNQMKLPLLLYASGNLDASVSRLA